MRSLWITIFAFCIRLPCTTFCSSYTVMLNYIIINYINLAPLFKINSTSSWCNCFFHLAPKPYNRRTVFGSKVLVKVPHFPASCSHLAADQCVVTPCPRADQKKTHETRSRHSAHMVFEFIRRNCVVTFSFFTNKLINAQYLTYLNQPHVCIAWINKRILQSPLQCTSSVRLAFAILSLVLA